MPVTALKNSPPGPLAVTRASATGLALSPRTTRPARGTSGRRFTTISSSAASGRVSGRS
jgi:hypothetical protein